MRENECGASVPKPLGFHVELLAGSAIEPYIEKMTEFRLKYFRVYPYLCEGTREEEMTSVRRYIDSASGHILVLKDENDNFGGFLTGISILESSYSSEFSAVLPCPEKAFYIGELIFAESFRGRDGIQKCLEYFHLIKEMGYESVCCITVQRAEDHPLKPDKYRDVSVLCKVLGFKKIEQTITISWPVIQSDGIALPMGNIMNIWVRDL
ncbi:MAG: hypothetical protein V4544_00060 [Pseudomonadota bacterium]